MRLVCPSCGAVASAEAWVNDSAIRYFFDALVQLPSPVLRQMLAYLGLFRQGTKALPWRRALVIARSLKDLVETGTVHWQGGETRPCTPEIWGKAMEATIASGPKGLKNHNYLRHVAWETAAELAAKMESDREASRQRRHQEREDNPEPMSDTSLQAIAELKKKWRQS
ncbi:MAG: hypothetical protein M0P16_00575 [Syntrophales bacterium]|nr:hypothetical protein [Syntrophales bacterium]MCK9390281.1 hypothetical protein [Syntrophales bacterium]